jgi:hypothetical protein
MESLFEEINSNCENKKVKSLCNKLNKKLSFKSGKDIENLCHLVYWLYILDKIELAKKCIQLTHEIQFNQNYNVWDFIHVIWGLEIRILQQDKNKKLIDEIIIEMDNNLKIPTKIETAERAQIRENKRRERFTLETITNKKQIEDDLSKGDIKNANEWRFISLFSLIGYTETGFYPKLNSEKDKIEKIIQKYIKEIINNGVRPYVA